MAKGSLAWSLKLLLSWVYGVALRRTQMYVDSARTNMSTHRIRSLRLTSIMDQDRYPSRRLFCSRPKRVCYPVQSL
ncbi:hypothetical protein FIBSPDRAFT_181989 [Athelia psychrophila]|uniref:Secreted protein n=1 Tax=Athelia psychrophila TaxID=1759441 RepID=A0A166AKW4_9AGAM|nr:hypothetical protein FIBSPDRAFT_181989 [Fibularhizoctonia sp. CBS 109695]